MKRITSLLILALALILAGCSAQPQPKYVFYLIGDGMGINQVIGTELYNQATGREPAQVNFAHFPVRGFVTTHSASALVTDSAAGGTALATGVKTYNSAIGVNADTVAVPSVADWAKAAGFGTGVITSVGVNHATPAAFMAHTAKRKNYEDIATQYIEGQVDFAAGGGFIVEKKSGHTPAYFEQMADSAGITVLRGKEAFADVAAVEGRVLCLGNRDQSDLPYSIDQEEGDVKLADLVDAGIRYLEARFGQKGFFCMIEGGKIDYAGHARDAAACFQELTDFAKAIDVVLAFKERHPKETLIVITADHETGGLMLGAGRYEMHPELLAVQHRSLEALTGLFRETFFPEGQPYKTPSWEAVKAFFTQELGLWDSVEVTPKAEAEFQENFQHINVTEANLYSVNYAIVSDAVKYLDKAAGYNWSYGSHSGSPVGLYADGPCAAAFGSVRDNTEIAPLIATLAGYQR